MTDQAQPQTRVFISYSRRDMAFADRLEPALWARGFEPLIDRSEIYAFEDWWKRIEDLIAHADTVVFVLSADAVASDICRKEVAFAASLNKRLAPIVYRRVDDRSVPQELQRLNFIFFDDDAKFDESIGRLAEALETDIAWVRRHTEFGEHARRWATAGRPGPRGLLLRPPVLDEAERWIASRPRGAPPPTEATQAFIAESRRAATRRRNVLTGSLGAGFLIALALAGLASWHRGIAVEQRGIAVEQRDKALITQSRFLADLANQLSASGDSTTAALLALEGLPDVKASVFRPYVKQTEAALYKSLGTPRELAVLAAPKTSIDWVQWSVDGTRILTSQQDLTVRVWDGLSGRLLATHGPFPGLQKALFDPSAARISINTAGASYFIDTMSGRMTDATPSLLRAMEHFKRAYTVTADWARIVVGPTISVAEIDPATGELRSVTPLEDIGNEDEFDFTEGGNYLCGRSGAVWETRSGKKIARPVPQMPNNDPFPQKHVLRPDGKRIVTGYYDGSARVRDLKTREQIYLVQHPEDERIKGTERDSATVYDIAFSMDARWLATASADKTVRIWNADSGQPVAVLRGHTNKVRDVDFSGDSKRLLSRADDGTVRLWSVVTDTEIIPPKHLGSFVFGVLLRKNAVWLLAIAEDKSVMVWDHTNQALVATLKGNTPNYIREAFSNASIDRTGRWLSTSLASDKTTRVWDLATSEEVFQCDNCNTGFSDDGRLAFVVSSEMTIWELESRTVLRRIPMDSGSADQKPLAFSCGSFNRDATKIAVSVKYEGVTPDGQAARIFDVRTGKLIGRFGSRPLECARFLPNEKHMLIDNRIVDLETSAIVQEFMWGSEIWDVNVSRDGKILMLLDDENTVTIYNVPEVKVLREITDVGGITRAGLTPDDRYVITTAGGDFFANNPQWRAHLWPVFDNLDLMMEHAKATVPRCLTAAQREQFYLDPAPPAWCVELAKWPYQSSDWKDWLKYKSAGADPPLPYTPEWGPWIAARQAVRR